MMDIIFVALTLFAFLVIGFLAGSLWQWFVDNKGWDDEP